MNKKYKFLSTLGIWSSVTLIALFGQDTEVIKNSIICAGLISFIIWR